MDNILKLLNIGIGTVQVSMSVEALLAFANEVVNRTHNLQQPQSNQEEELLTRTRVMEYLGIKATTLWQWTKMGIITPIKIKRKCLYKKSDILAIQSNKNHLKNNHV